MLIYLNFGLNHYFHNLMMVTMSLVLDISKFFDFQSYQAFASTAWADFVKPAIVADDMGVGSEPQWWLRKKVLRGLDMAI